MPLAIHQQALKKWGTGSSLGEAAHYLPYTGEEVLVAAFGTPLPLLEYSLTILYFLLKMTIQATW